MLKPVRPELSNKVLDKSEDDEPSFFHCVSCKKQVDADNEEDIYNLYSCNHTICNDCFIDLIKVEYSVKKIVDCPSCGKIVHEDEIIDQLGEEEWAELKEEILEDDEEVKEGAVRCRCGEEVKVVKHKVKNVDEEGNQISAKSAENMAKFKVKCHNCRDVFCAYCKIKPYHIGYTCSEYREFVESDRCRYCSEPIKARRKGGAFRFVCKSKECKSLKKEGCSKKLPCGHYCNGISREKHCLPCLHPDCVNKDQSKTLGENDNSNCVICFDKSLGKEPCIQLPCKHIFHVLCLVQKVEAKWPGPRVTFIYKTCPSCKAEIGEVYHIKLKRLIDEAIDLESKVRAKAVERGTAEGLDKDERLQDENDEYFEKFEDYCMDRLAFYQCYKCKKPYFGGLRECGAALDAGDGFDEKELICGACSGEDFKGKVHCDTHGDEFIEFKCRYCCNYSQWFCFGNTHFCNRCHSNLTRNIIKCPGPPECVLEMEHPDDGSEFAMGCGMCRNNLASNRV
ncbi:unnamed protein product [Moneuplotes crassus]|uniref:RING-type domain-containing protein n=1 Tax=Euplotes crassus TaxID=5936 RepID=A0AAD1UA13_EUPCR|nr:unnamed protein product [Moneuplotes crassus]